LTWRLQKQMQDFGPKWRSL
jgi:hypothetical protein